MPVSRRAVLKGLVGGGLGAVAGSGAYGYFYARRHVTVTRTTVPVIGLSPALAGLTIGLLTDVHHSQWVSQDEVAHAAATLVAEHTDLILLGGDYVTWGDRDYVEPAAEALGRLTAPLGVFGVIGNHDDERDMPAALSKHGIEMLNDARTTLTVRGETLDLVGLRYWTKRLDRIQALADRPRGTTVLLAHDPRRLTAAAALGIPLVLSGHTHGGQVVLPLLGAVAARKFPLVAGVGRRDRTTIFVSRGLGTVYVPVRLNCPPEVVVLTLASADEATTVETPPAV